MNAILRVAALLGLLASLPAQNWFEIYPTDFPTSGAPTAYDTGCTRLGVPPGVVGEVLMEVPDSPPLGNDFFRGVGGYCGVCCIDAVRVALCDSLPGTCNQYQVVIRANNAAGPLCGAPLFLSPVYFTNGQAFGLYTVPAPLTTLPCTGGFSIGVVFQNTDTVADNLSVASASYLPLAATAGDFPVGTAPSYAWTIVGACVNATLSASRVALRVAVRTCDTPLPGHRAVLNMGNRALPPARLPAWADSYGVGGMWPSCVGGPPHARPVASGDGIQARIIHAPHAIGSAVLLASPVVLPVPLFVLPDPCAGLWLAPPLLVFNVGNLDYKGELRAQLLPPGNHPGLCGNALWFQAATIDPSFTAIDLSNAQKVQW